MRVVANWMRLGARAIKVQTSTPQTQQEPTMTTTAFNTRPALNLLGEGLMLVAMLGMTAAGATVWASGPAPVVHKLETVVVTAKAPVVHQLPTVYVIGKRQPA
jgi:hypothetical protein